ncbi:MAG: BirA family biotin operon repressor/biotin-[acetyl-CoA-carboxylase] ligase [Flavobacteriales bacterium]|jgi:BirA family biotin operon repressor/biotin-[acetyl-CoA-carboxylase] ligase
MSAAVGGKTLFDLVELMSDGAWYSGSGLGESLGLSRAAVWKSLKGLGGLGLSCESQPGKGYRLVGGVDLLSEPLLREGLSCFGVDLSVDVVRSIDSTNALMMRSHAAGLLSSPRVVVAEMQSAGRGRRGRAWHSPYGSNLYLSFSWVFTAGVAAIEGLSLAVGVAICEALSELGCDGVKLKWPNDILFDGKKLGGVLIELVGDVSGDCTVIIGVGLNCGMQDANGAQIDQPWIDLRECGCQSSRVELCQAVISSLYKLLDDYGVVGFSAYRERWEGLSAYSGQNVSIVSGSSVVRGCMIGLSESGALRLLVDGREQVFVGGEVSLRLSE